MSRHVNPRLLAENPDFHVNTPYLVRVVDFEVEPDPRPLNFYLRGKIVFDVFEFDPDDPCRLLAERGLRTHVYLDATWRPVDEPSGDLIRKLRVSAFPQSELQWRNSLIGCWLRVKLGAAPVPGGHNPLQEFESIDPPEGQVVGARPMIAATSPNDARRLLSGWQEICAAVGVSCESKSTRKLKELNETRRGPIISHGQGKPPEVYHDELVIWWNNQLEQFREIVEQRSGETQQLGGSHPFGRDGSLVFPDDGMHERRRRSDFGQKRGS